MLQPPSSLRHRTLAPQPLAEVASTRLKAELSLLLLKWVVVLRGEEEEEFPEGMAGSSLRPRQCRGPSATLETSTSGTPRLLLPRRAFRCMSNRQCLVLRRGCWEAKVQASWVHPRQFSAPEAWVEDAWVQ